MFDKDTEWITVGAEEEESPETDTGSDKAESAEADAEVPAEFEAEPAVVAPQSSDDGELFDVEDILDIDPETVRSSFKAMVSFFTVIRLDVGEGDIEAFEKNTWTIPIIGALVGFVGMITGMAMWYLGFDLLTSAVAIMAAVLLFTRFLHFDGLADFGDAFVATGDREKRRKALKDTATGAGGAGMAIIVTLAAVALLSSFSLYMLLLIWPLEIMVKNAMVAAAAWGEPGDGMAARQVRGTGRKTLVKSSVLTFVLAFGVMLVSLAAVQVLTGFEFLDREMIIFSAATVITGTAASIITGIGMAAWANRELGFVNGDILGASNEISRVIILVLVTIVLFQAGLV